MRTTKLKIVKFSPHEWCDAIFLPLVCNALARLYWTSNQFYFNNHIHIERKKFFEHNRPKVKPNRIVSILCASQF